MENLGTLYGIPHEIERWETIYPGRDGVTYKKVECKVWVDEGGEYLMPLKFEAWVERRGLLFGDPIPGFDIRIHSEDQYGPVDLRTAPGEVVDPEPMEVEPESPLPMEIDAHEDFFAEDGYDEEEDPIEPIPDDFDPKELPSSEQSGAESDYTGAYLNLTFSIIFGDPAWSLPRFHPCIEPPTIIMSRRTYHVI